MADMKTRRKALGWDRAELAERSGLPRPVVQLCERGEWTEYEALGRIEVVLKRAEEGDPDPRLPPISNPDAPTGPPTGEA